MLVLSIGLAVTVAPLTSTALGSVSETRAAGLASAVNNDVARLEVSSPWPCYRPWGASPD